MQGFGWDLPTLCPDNRNHVAPPVGMRRSSEDVEPDTEGPATNRRVFQNIRSRTPTKLILEAVEQEITATINPKSNEEHWRQTIEATREVRTWIEWWNQQRGETQERPNQSNDGHDSSQDESQNVGGSAINPERSAFSLESAGVPRENP
ncbi:hypothetical protein R1sor_022241 [Riccia sorocarpa]|uniref:Uncharacterized protein n=1 Tax=Riccia sorocarpa TaxID=122646 RepID=A0ABD3GML7_9MARC